MVHPNHMTIKYIGQVLNSFNTASTDIHIAYSDGMFGTIIRALKKDGITINALSRTSHVCGFTLEKDGEVSEYDLSGNIIVDVELEEPENESVILF